MTYRNQTRNTRMKRLIVITGPTASGKSALAVSLAQMLHTEIVSADSRQVFQGIPIATAMPTPGERAAVPHHLIDFLPLDCYYSAAQYEQDALACLRRIFATRDYAVVCGGSMMYVDALCNGIDELPTVPDALRRSLMAQHAEYGDDWLRMRLLALDPEHYARVDLMNVKCVFHAVEVSEAAGVPYSSLLGKARRGHDYDVLKVQTTMPRDMLFDRINLRVGQMAEQGLVEEVRSVAHLRHLNSLNTVGVKEILRYLDGEWDLETALSRMAKNTRVYAKKQMTWFKRDPDIVPLDMTQPDPTTRLAEMARSR